MAQIQTLKDRGTGKTVYPVTTSKAVFDENGVDLDTRLEKQKQSTENALKEYAKRTEVTQGLNAKQDKLSTTTDLHITDDNIIGLTDMAKKRLFIDMWNEAWKGPFLMDFYDSSSLVEKLGEYDYDNAPDKTKPFKAYDMWLSYEEAIAVMDDYKWGKGEVQLEGMLQEAKGKVALPFILGTGSENIDITDLLVYNRNIEEICFCFGRYTFGYSASILKAYRAFHMPHANPGLRKIHGTIPLAQNANLSACFVCKNLKSVHIRFLRQDIRLDNCPELDLDSFIYMVTYATNTAAIVITVHADVYAKLTGDTTNEAAAALTAEELAQWQQVCLDANARNIAFATA